MKHLHKFFFILLFIFNCQLFADDKNVFILHSYHDTLSWQRDMDEGFDEFENEHENYHFFIENMDTFRIKHKDDINWQEYLKEKYKNKRIDIVLANSNDASLFISKYGEELFGKVPTTLYTGIDIKQKSFMKNFRSNFQKAVKETVNIALKQNPNAKNIYIIKGKHSLADNLNENLNTNLKQISNLNIVTIKDFTFEELKYIVSQISKDSIMGTSKNCT